MPRNNIKKVKTYSGKMPSKGTDSNILENSFGGVTIPAVPGFTMDDEPLVNYLLDMADELDENDLEKEADFIDFLIYKYAEKEDYFDKFTDYIMNMHDSEQKVHDKIQDFTNEYIFSYNTSYNRSAAGRKAYEKATEISLEKKAGTLEDDPFYVAEQIVKIIKIMINTMRGEKRPDAYRNISNKVFTQFNPLEMSQKKAPGGAAIGVSLALIKNILNSKPELFIKLVLDEVRKKLGY